MMIQPPRQVDRNWRRVSISGIYFLAITLVPWFLLIWLAFSSRW
jgi:hypothetical protein